MRSSTAAPVRRDLQPDMATGRQATRETCSSDRSSTRSRRRTCPCRGWQAVSLLDTPSHRRELPSSAAMPHRARHHSRFSGHPPARTHARALERTCTLYAHARWYTLAQIHTHTHTHTLQYAQHEVYRGGPPAQLPDAGSHDGRPQAALRPRGQERRGGEGIDRRHAGAKDQCRQHPAAADRREHHACGAPLCSPVRSPARGSRRTRAPAGVHTPTSTRPPARFLPVAAARPSPRAACPFTLRPSSSPTVRRCRLTALLGLYPKKIAKAIFFSARKGYIIAARRGLDRGEAGVRRWGAGRGGSSCCSRSPRCAGRRSWRALQRPVRPRAASSRPPGCHARAGCTALQCPSGPWACGRPPGPCSPPHTPPHVPPQLVGGQRRPEQRRPRSRPCAWTRRSSP